MVNREFDEGFKTGFNAAVKMALEAIANVETEDMTQPSRYEEWVRSDRRASDVKADCEHQVRKLTYTRFN